jgi:hypothetical protein
MSLSLLLSIVALVLAIIVGVINRGSTPMLLTAVAIALLALVHVLAGSLVVVD